MSWGDRDCGGKDFLSCGRSDMIDEKWVAHFNEDISARPSSFWTTTICLRDGTLSDSSLELARSGTNCSMRGRLDRGNFRGRFTSVLMIRCEASR